MDTRPRYAISLSTLAHKLVRLRGVASLGLVRIVSCAVILRHRFLTPIGCFLAATLLVTFNFSAGATDICSQNFHPLDCVGVEALASVSGSIQDNFNPISPPTTFAIVGGPGNNLAEAFANGVTGFLGAGIVIDGSTSGSAIARIHDILTVTSSGALPDLVLSVSGIENIGGSAFGLFVFLRSSDLTVNTSIRVCDSSFAAYCTVSVTNGVATLTGNALLPLPVGTYDIFVELDAEASLGQVGFVNFFDTAHLALVIPDGATVTSFSGNFLAGPQAPVPEPATLALLGLGLAGLGFSRRKQ